MSTQPKTLGQVAAEKLLPCPFCGNTKPELVETHLNHWRVGCSKCGSYNNNSLGPERAFDTWNRRIDSTIAAQPTPDIEQIAREAAISAGCSAWGYFKGGDAGSASAMLWFKNNLELGGPKHMVEERMLPIILRACQAAAQAALAQAKEGE